MSMCLDSRGFLWLLLVGGCPVVPELFVEKTIFSLLYCLCSFVEDYLTLFVWVYFWTLSCSVDVSASSLASTTQT